MDEPDDCVEELTNCYMTMRSLRDKPRLTRQDRRDQRKFRRMYRRVRELEDTANDEIMARSKALMETIQRKLDRQMDTLTSQIEGRMRGTVHADSTDEVSTILHDRRLVSLIHAGCKKPRRSTALQQALDQFRTYIANVDVWAGFARDNHPVDGAPDLDYLDEYISSDQNALKSIGKGVANARNYARAESYVTWWDNFLSSMRGTMNRRQLSLICELRDQFVAFRNQMRVSLGPAVAQIMPNLFTRPFDPRYALMALLEAVTLANTCFQAGASRGGGGGGAGSRKPGAGREAWCRTRSRKPASAAAKAQPSLRPPAAKAQPTQHPRPWRPWLEPGRRLPKRRAQWGRVDPQRRRVHARRGRVHAQISHPEGAAGAADVQIDGRRAARF